MHAGVNDHAVAESTPRVDGGIRADAHIGAEFDRRMHPRRGVRPRLGARRVRREEFEQSDRREINVVDLDERAIVAINAHAAGDKERRRRTLRRARPVPFVTDEREFIGARLVDRREPGDDDRVVTVHGTIHEACHIRQRDHRDAILHCTRGRS